MPNYVQHKLTIKADNLGEILQFIKGESDDAIDFNAIIPMPKSLHIIKSSLRYETQLLIPKDLCDVNEITDDIRRGVRMKIKEWRDEKEFEDILRDAVIANDNFKRYGFCDWYDWSVVNWGTKWNAFDSYIEDDIVYFQTAWESPVPIFETLSKKFPNAVFEVEYADEDWGRNCGFYAYEDGIGTEISNFQTDKEALAFAKRLWGFSDNE